jgi:hypothetical protein
MHPIRFASVAIIGCLAITTADIVTGLEHWPFGSYPMYSTLYSAQFSWLRIYGVTDGGEILLRGERDFAPFDEARLIAALGRLQSAGDGERKLDEALGNLMRIYNRRHDRSPIRILRLYDVRWTLRPGLAGTEPPGARTLVGQVSEDGGAGR